VVAPADKLAEAKRQLGFPGIVVMCGSTRFMAEMAEAELRETTARTAKIVVKPECDLKSQHELRSDPVENEALTVRLDDLHRWRILLTDEVLVVGDSSADSTGPSTPGRWASLCGSRTPKPTPTPEGLFPHSPRGTPPWE
jgi:hypothetical protein